MSALDKTPGNGSLRWTVAAGNFPAFPASYRQDLRAIHAYARFVSDLREPAAVERDLTALYAGRVVRHPVVRALAPAVTRRAVPERPLRRLIEAGRVDRAVRRYGSFDELARFCGLSASPVGELVLHVFGQVTPWRVELSDRICTALQIIEHLRSVRDDHGRGRVYLPADEMARFDVDEIQLGRPRAEPAVRDLVALLAERAAAWLDAGAPLVSDLRGWGRLAVSGSVARGRAALAALAASGYDPAAGPAPTGGRRVFGHWLAATLRTAG